MKILVIDDHPVVCHGIRAVFARDAGVTIVDAGDATAALAMARAETFDLYILDIKLNHGSGLEVLRRLKAYDRTARVLVYTAAAEPALASRAIRSGALGYVTKAASLEELREGIRHVANNERFVDSEMSCKVSIYCTGTEDGISRLNDRELEILRLLGEGRSLQQIASECGFAYKTIANTCSRIKDKLDMRRTSELIRFYMEPLRV